MNNKVVKIISSVVLLGGALILLIGTNFPKFEDLTLDEIIQKNRQILYSVLRSGDNNLVDLKCIILSHKQME